MKFLSFIGIIPFVIVFLIFYLIANSKTKKYIDMNKIADGGTVKVALFLTFLTYFVTVSLIYFQLSTGQLYWMYLMFLSYGLLGTIAHIFVRGHRIMQGKNDITTILNGLTYHCWEVWQLIVLAVTTVIDIIASFIADDLKQSNKRINAREQTEKYFRENSVDKPNNYQDGLNIEYSDFLKTSLVEDNSDTRKIFADEYFKNVYDK